MWFRVELHKDGSVAKCETVEGKLKDGKHVFYVEADTKEKALASAVRCHMLYLEKERAREARTQASRREARLCIQCGKAPPVAGNSRCKTCRDNLRQYSRVSYERRKHAGTIGTSRYRDIEKRALNFETKRKESNSARRERERAVFGTTDGARAAAYKLTFARQSLATLDSLHPDMKHSPYRKWLVAQIRDMETDLAKCRKRDEDDARDIQGIAAE